MEKSPAVTMEFILTLRPAGAQELPALSRDYLYSTLFTHDKICYRNPIIKSNHDVIQTKQRHLTLMPGVAEGYLMGGNLTVLTSIIGSAFFPKDWQDKILFLEDVHENVYKIERMFTQLKLAGVLSQIKGLVLGSFIDCEVTIFQSPNLIQLFKQITHDISVPCYANATFGHQNENFTLPIGARVLLDANQGTMTLL
jgi:muramoyltetrapeptide carboxypeptidase